MISEYCSDNFTAKLFSKTNNAILRSRGDFVYDLQYFESQPVSHIKGSYRQRTWVADKNALKLSQSLTISASNSARSVFPFTQSRAAIICSDWIRSTVLLNDTVHGSANALRATGGEPVRELR